MKDVQCSACGGATFVGSQSLTTAGPGSQPPLKVLICVYADPNAFFMKGEVYSEIRTHICTQCGKIELYAAELAKLVAARRQGERS